MGKKTKKLKRDLEDHISTLDEEMVYLRNELAFAVIEAQAWKRAMATVRKSARLGLAPAFMRTSVNAAARKARKEIADGV